MYKLTNNHSRKFARSGGLEDDGADFENPSRVLEIYEHLIEGGEPLRPTLFNVKKNPLEIYKDGKRITVSELVQDVVDLKKAEINAIREKYGTGSLSNQPLMNIEQLQVAVLFDHRELKSGDWIEILAEYEYSTVENEGKVLPRFAARYI